MRANPAVIFLLTTLAKLLSISFRPNYFLRRKTSPLTATICSSSVCPACHFLSSEGHFLTTFFLARVLILSSINSYARNWWPKLWTRRIDYTVFDSRLFCVVCKLCSICRNQIWHVIYFRNDWKSKEQVVIVNIIILFRSRRPNARHPDTWSMLQRFKGY